MAFHVSGCENQDAGVRSRQPVKLMSTSAMSTSAMIVVGSGPAGVSAAEAFRRHDAVTPVRILTDDAALPYYRPPLSKEFLRAETDDVFLHPPQWYAERRIDVVHSAVESVDPDGHFVVAGGQ